MCPNLFLSIFYRNGFPLSKQHLDKEGNTSVQNENSKLVLKQSPSPKKWPSHSLISIKTIRISTFKARFSTSLDVVAILYKIRLVT